MHGPGSASWLLVALCAGSGAYCLLRMRSGAEEQRRTAGGEALMGFGMAVMALPAAVLDPPREVWLGYAAVFAAAGLRTAWPAGRGPRHLRRARSPRHLHHAVGALAMVYMSAAMVTAPGGHAAGHGGAGVPAVTGALLLYFAGHVLLSGARLAPVGGAPGTGAPDLGTPGHRRPPLESVGGWADRPELVLVCRLAMSMGMLAMLLAL
ncbi:DUF5134 domain-containing protein [Streptomyces sp. p1417]|uniref:DUF5134 domain-containing protein n=1 Tax=Streptomyces typhae TaxID=2681492 RepID=A0A6L6X1K5_9ACTN|nr:DUF5134 domain-containing protein [Streptomyces typhae]MVO87651.1 DUF5134 domain-containing protein [Streptomyces typhae]